MPSLPHREVAQKRNYIGADVNQQNTAKANLVENEADDRTRDQPSALHPGKQKSIGVNKFFARRQLLNEGGNGWPKHPETGSHQHVHRIQFPDFHSASKSQQRNRQNDDRA